jgi:hypothetical protein
MLVLEELEGRQIVKAVIYNLLSSLQAREIGTFHAPTCQPVSGKKEGQGSVGCQGV